MQNGKTRLDQNLCAALIIEELVYASWWLQLPSTLKANDDAERN